MPDIVQGTDAPVNGPPVPAAVAPMNGPPVPVDARPVEGPPVPAGTPVTPPAAQSSGTSVPELAPPPPVTDPLEAGRRAIGDAQAAQADERKAAADEAKAQQEKNEAEAKQAEAQAAEIRKRQEENDRRQQAADQARARLTALAEKADNDVGNFKFTDYMNSIPSSKKAKLMIGGLISGVYGGTDLTEQINKLTAQHFEQQKAELSSKENFAKYRRQGIEDHDRHINDQRMYLEFQERNYREAMAKETEALGLRSGNPVAAAKAQQLAAKMRADGDAKLMTMVDQYAKAEEQRAHADLLKRKAGRGGAGGGSSDAISKVIDAAQSGQKPGEVAKLAARLGIKDPIGTVKKVYADLKAGGGAEGVDTKLLVHNADGTPAGLASTSRAVPQIQKDLRTLPRAIEQLKQLREANDWKMTQRDPRFHNAVLAVAATTSAGSTDANVAHEKGTLTNALGIPSNEAIDRKIAELENQLAATQNQLEPLPENYVPAKRPAKASGAAPAPAGGITPAQAATLEKLAKLGFKTVQ